MKDKNFKNYLEKNNNLSESTLFLREYGYQLINKFVNLDEKINEFKKLENDLNQEKDTNKVLRKRIADLEKKRKNYLK